MKISTKGRYSLRMMLDLSMRYESGEFSSLKDISARQNISKKYLEQLVPFLNRSGLLVTNRGNTGGYRLSKQPSEIMLYEVLQSAEGSLCPVSCIECAPHGCENRNDCLTLPVWEGLNEVITNYLQSISLQDIINGTRSMVNGPKGSTVNS